MSRQYCYDIYNPNDEYFDPEDLKNYIRDIYVGRGDDKFKSGEEPFVVIHAKSDGSVCIVVSGRGKKNQQKIDEIHKSLRKGKLKWKGVTLSEPYIFEAEKYSWWEDDKTAQKWETLEHRGPYFTHLMESYIPLGSSLTYEGKSYPLYPEEEKIARFYAQRLLSEQLGTLTEEFTKDAIFNANFWNDFKKYLTPEHRKIFKDFKKIGWDDIVQDISDDKERKSAKVLSKQQKKEKTVSAEEKKREYGYGFIDGRREKIGNFVIEPSAIFIGRGDNKLRGKVKPEIYPEDVTINIGDTAKIPRPPAGHNWGGIVHDHNGAWLARWKSSVGNEVKYVMFGLEGTFKGKSDLVKYEKARKLGKFLDVVRAGYMSDILSRIPETRQLATVLYLIDNYGIRVGGEKDKDEAQTVGASTLKVGNIKLEPPHTIVFDFLGKDSIRYYKELEVPRDVFLNFSAFVNGKDKDAQVFDLISAQDINRYLKKFDKNFSAKVFRTRLASSIMHDALKDVRIPPGATKQKIKTLFNKANAKVAEVLNHTRNISKKRLESVEKDKDALKKARAELKDRKREGKSTKTIEKRIDSLENKIAAKSDVMSVAITTSLNNYIDPRLIASWVKTQDIGADSIYTAQLMNKFDWAIEMTDADWDYDESPLVGNPNLEPSSTDKDSVTTRKTTSSKRTTSTKRTIPTTKRKPRFVPQKGVELLVKNFCGNPSRESLLKFTEDSVVRIKEIADYVVSNNEGKIELARRILDVIDSLLRGDAPPPGEEVEFEESSALTAEKYSENAIIIRGDTSGHEDRIRAIGGKWKESAAGWIFPKKSKNQVDMIVAYINSYK